MARPEAALGTGAEDGRGSGGGPIAAKPAFFALNPAFSLL